MSDSAIGRRALTCPAGWPPHPQPPRPSSAEAFSPALPARNTTRRLPRRPVATPEDVLPASRRAVGRPAVPTSAAPRHPASHLPRRPTTSPTSSAAQSGCPSRPATPSSVASPALAHRALTCLAGRSPRLWLPYRPAGLGRRVVGRPQPCRRRASRLPQHSTLAVTPAGHGSLGHGTHLAGKPTRPWQPHPPSAAAPSAAPPSFGSARSSPRQRTPCRSAARPSPRGRRPGLERPGLGRPDLASRLSPPSAAASSAAFPGGSPPPSATPSARHPAAGRRPGGLTSTRSPRP